MNRFRKLKSGSKEGKTVSTEDDLLLVCCDCYCLFHMWATEACWHAVGKWKMQEIEGVTDIVRSWRG